MADEQSCTENSSKAESAGAGKWRSDDPHEKFGFDDFPMRDAKSG